MRQGSGLDEKESSDFLHGDWSERTEPLGAWCHWHGYHGVCPECSPDVALPEIPVVQAPIVPIVFPWEDPTPRLPVLDQATPAQQGLGSDPALLERVTTMLEPDYEAARLRGRQVHTDALELVDGTGCSYPEAIAEVLARAPSRSES